MDTLEIVLKEQLDVVDRFFLAEADFNHKGVNQMLRIYFIFWHKPHGYRRENLLCGKPWRKLKGLVLCQRIKQYTFQ